MRRRRLRALALDRRGATLTEFAFVAPVLLATLTGFGDLMYQSYVQAVLDGAMTKAGRDSALEMNADNAAAMDAHVEELVRQVAPRARFHPSVRRSYASFSLVKPEPFNDRNRNGVRDPGECFDDVNGNGIWDADPGIASQGGANDVTRYTMTISYPRLFPARLVGWPAEVTTSATTLLKNQPYRTQRARRIESICS